MNLLRQTITARGGLVPGNEYLDVFVDLRGNVSLRATILAEDEASATEALYDILDVLSNAVDQGLTYENAALTVTRPSNNKNAQNKWVLRWLGTIPICQVPEAKVAARRLDELLQDSDMTTGEEDGL